MAEVTYTKTVTKTIEVPDMTDTVKASTEYCAPLLRDAQEMSKTAEASRSSVIEQIIVWINEYFKPFFNEENGKYIPYDGRCCFAEDCKRIRIRYGYNSDDFDYLDVLRTGLDDRSLSRLRGYAPHTVAGVASHWAESKRNIIRSVENDMESWRNECRLKFENERATLKAIEEFEV